MFDTRIIRRLAYDGNYQRAIELIVDIIDGKKNYFEVKEDLEKRRKASSITTENARLKSCLQEIKKIAEKLMADNLCNNCDGIGLDANCQYTGCPYYQMDKILQKITKAEEE